MDQNEEYKLRLWYSSIIHGFSICEYNGTNVYVKHWNTLDNLETDFLYESYYKKAKDRGYPTEEERVSQLKKDELWNDSDENHIKNLKDSISSLRIAKKKAMLKRDMDSVNDQIKEQELLLSDLTFKRETLIGSTVENFARRQVDTYLIFKSFYQDIELKTLLFSKEEFDELETKDLNKLFLIYNEVMQSFSENNLKRVALSPFFQNAFSLCDSIYEFYGKPVCYLTNFQIHLASSGAYYKTILNSDMKPPKELLSDPDKLEDWFNSKSNAEQMLQKNAKDEASNVSIMGATKEDLKNWGYEVEEDLIAKKTREKGGELSMQEIMALEGVQ